LAIYLSSLGGSVNVGVYSLTTDEIVIIPKYVPVKKAERLAQWLRVKLIHSAIGDSVLIGALACANSNGILLPNYVRQEELDDIKSVFKGNIAVMETKKTAYGNLVLANDRGAIADPRLKETDIRKISDTLGVETVAGEVAGLPYVGSLAVATNKGVLAHPLLSDSEKKLLEDTFKVSVDVGTVNCGIPFAGAGMICNRYTAIAGSLTTGPEMFIIGNTLDVVKEDAEIESIQSNG